MSTMSLRVHFHHYVINFDFKTGMNRTGCATHSLQVVAVLWTLVYGHD